MKSLHPLQIQRFREMTFQEKYRVHLGMMRMARDARLQAWQRLHPEWTQEQCNAAVAKEFTRGRP